MLLLTRDICIQIFLQIRFSGIPFLLSSIASILYLFHGWEEANFKDLLHKELFTETYAMLLLWNKQEYCAFSIGFDDKNQDLFVFSTLTLWDAVTMPLLFILVQ